MALPACVAWMSQVPAMRNEAVLPESVQTVGVTELRVTGRPELELALSASCDKAYLVPVTGVTVMLWWARCTTTTCVTGNAAPYRALPACVACRMQEPPMSNETVLPETVQTVGVVVLKLTARPELRR